MSREERAAAIFAANHGVITWDQARIAGYTPEAIRCQLRVGLWIPYSKGVYLLAGAPRTWEQRAAAAAAAGGDGAAVSHRAAAGLHGFSKAEPYVIDVTTRHGTHDGVGRGCRMHRARTFGDDDRCVISGIAVTCANRTLVDLASVASRRELAAALDKALLSGKVTIEGLRSYIESRRLTRNRGVKRLLALARNREEGVPESELERGFLELVERYGLPAPVRQHPEARYRADFAYIDVRLMIEVDGRASHATEEAFQADRDRQNDLMLLGWTVLRFTWRDVTRRPAEVARKVRAALGRAGLAL